MYMYVYMYVNRSRYSLTTYSNVSSRKENVWTAEVARFGRIYSNINIKPKE